MVPKIRVRPLQATPPTPQLRAEIRRFLLSLANDAQPNYDAGPHLAQCCSTLTWRSLFCASSIERTKGASPPFFCGCGLWHQLEVKTTPTFFCGCGLWHQLETDRQCVGRRDQAPTRRGLPRGHTVPAWLSPTTLRTTTRQCRVMGRFYSFVHF